MLRPATWSRSPLGGQTPPRGSGWRHPLASLHEVSASAALGPYPPHPQLTAVTYWVPINATKDQVGMISMYNSSAELGWDLLYLIFF